MTGASLSPSLCIFYVSSCHWNRKHQWGACRLPSGVRGPGGPGLTGAGCSLQTGPQVHGPAKPPRAPAGGPPCLHLAVPQAAPAWFSCHCHCHIHLHLMGHSATGHGANSVELSVRKRGVTGTRGWAWGRPAARCWGGLVHVPGEAEGAGDGGGPKVLKSSTPAAPQARHRRTPRPGSLTAWPRPARAGPLPPVP